MFSDNILFTIIYSTYSSLINVKIYTD